MFKPQPKAPPKVVVEEKKIEKKVEPPSKIV